MPRKTAVSNRALPSSITKSAAGLQKTLTHQFKKCHLGTYGSSIDYFQHLSIYPSMEQKTMYIPGPSSKTITKLQCLKDKRTVARMDHLVLLLRGETEPLAFTDITTFSNQKANPKQLIITISQQQ